MQRERASVLQELVSYAVTRLPYSPHAIGQIAKDLWLKKIQLHARQALITRRIGLTSPTGTHGAQIPIYLLSPDIHLGARIRQNSRVDCAAIRTRVPEIANGQMFSLERS